MGRSRGGLTTKILAVVDASGLPLRYALSLGQAHDSTLTGPLFDDQLLPDGFVLPDKAYDTEWIRAMIEPQDAVPITCSSVRVPGRPGRGLSNNPSMRSFRKRRRHLPTVCSCTPSSAATALFVGPSAQRKIMRQRTPNASATLTQRRLPDGSSCNAVAELLITLNCGLQTGSSVDSVCPSAKRDAMPTFSRR